MSNTLLPCPFCGGKAEFQGDYGVFYVQCTNCGAMSSTVDEEQEASPCDAVAIAWNRRTDHIRDTTKKVSNADSMRGMSDEELHKFLLDFEAGDIDYAKTFCDLCCKDAALEQRSTDCEGCLLWWLKNDATLPQGIDWLKQPVKEVHNGK